MWFSFLTPYVTSLVLELTYDLEPLISDFLNL